MDLIHKGAYCVRYVYSSSPSLLLTCKGRLAGYGGQGG
ncbi:predicted protein [Sclerotinia sclerotiorum 1980 UF-70]|uniref:Uncharacterized protein n=1 Tax=Sclerotinia sclerotiorum (strain ATCC 18683 / 1980 / Ss-1) TaxID=665079 RepID=A7EEX7_SCLS1|nr:predicted protein [Sclerotinia sclerotiorum 1980 UF-70]EDO01393.1 predicted protein [Sclerotinia sclerotiorum 1980 UF-70]